MGVYVLGMHRSGTSVLARLVGLLTGYEGHRGAEFDNVEGHWELPRMNHALESALKTVDSDWASPPLAPLEWDDPRLSSSREEVSDLVSSLGDRDWVLKDPRLCLTLSATLSLPQPPALLVGTFREPGEVAASLAARDHYEHEYGLAVWEVYNRLLLDQVRASDRPTTWVSYDALMTDPASSAGRLAGFLRAQGRSVGAEQVARAVAAVNPALRHQRLDRSELSTSQSALLSILREAAATGVTPTGALPPLTGWARALIETRRPYVHMERDNRYLTHRLRVARPAFRAYDAIRRRLGRPVPDDPFVRYT